MTAVPMPPGPMTLEEYFALPDYDAFKRTELHEGVLIMNAAPLPVHQRVIMNLVRQLDDQLPPEWESVFSADVVLKREFPPTVRQPDLVVTRTAMVASAKRLVAKDVILAVEVISPGSKRVHKVLKPVEYAEAGIRHYWVVDLEPPISLAAYHLAEAFEAYQEAPAATGEFVTQEPFPLRIDVARLTERP